MLVADDEAVEGCRTPARRGQKVANRGETCLATDELDIGTGSPLARGAGQCREVDIGGQRLATRVHLENLQPRCRIGQ